MRFFFLIYSPPLTPTQTLLLSQRPLTVSTVDQYQGQQNDYVLLSLVRTSGIGYLRDVRRMIVGLSRARLGLYTFGRRELFQGEIELTKCFNSMVGFKGGEKDGLDLVSGEFYGGVVRKAGQGVEKNKDLSKAVVCDVATMTQLSNSLSGVQ